MTERIVLPNQSAQSGDLIFCISPICAEHRAELMETHLVQMRPDANVRQLHPIGGWPKADGRRARGPRQPPQVRVNTKQTVPL